MDRKLYSELLNALTTVVGVAALAWVGCSPLADALAPLDAVPMPAGIPSLHVIVYATVMIAAALSGSGVYRGMREREAKDWEMYLRSLTTTTGQQPR
ncbi:hypothetical protein RHDC4_00347 [Rhodocyclaceae bacterium]|nr:hypothetical protein RHDC4_00347 [Rhodocyclaceae bacterium]